MKKIFIFCLFMILSLGIFAQKIITDGQVHFDKMINRKIDYTDTADSFKIIKKGNNYYITIYSYDPFTQKTTTSREKLKIHKKIYFIDRNGIVYAYDTAKKKVAFLNENLDLLHYEEK